MQILDELLLIKKKNSNISSQSRLSYNGNNELIFFEGLLGKIIKDQENDCIIKQNMVN